MALDISMLKHFVSVENLKKDAASKNFSIYGKWLGLLSVLLGLALGIANIFSFSLIIIFAIFAIVQAILVLLVELPFLLKICPLTSGFTDILKKFESHWPRFGFYLLLAIIQWLSIIVKASSLIALAVLWTICAVCYALSAFSNQEFHNSGAGPIINADASDIPPSAIRQIL